MESICDAITKIHIKRGNKRISQPNSFIEFTYKEVLQQAQTTLIEIRSAKNLQYFLQITKKALPLHKLWVSPIRPAPSESSRA